MTDEEYAEALEKRLFEELLPLAGSKDQAALRRRLEEVLTAFAKENPDAPKTLSGHLCSLCGCVFASLWPDEEAMAESRANFGDQPKEQLAVVCDDCWERVRPN